MVQTMAWRIPGDNSLSEPIMNNLLTHICITRPQCSYADQWRYVRVRTNWNLPVGLMSYINKPGFTYWFTYLWRINRVLHNDLCITLCCTRQQQRSTTGQTGLFADLMCSPFVSSCVRMILGMTRSYPFSRLKYQRRMLNINAVRCTVK